MYLGTAAFLDLKEDGKANEQVSFHRLPLGLYAESSAAGVWILEHDPTVDTGFRLYNPSNDCYLATTFRSAGLDQGTASHDDPTRAEGGKTLEASCTRLVSKSASTFWAIEGRLQHHSVKSSFSWRARLPPPARALVKSFQRGCSIIHAYVALYRWQSHYGQHLELVPSPLASSREQGRWETRVGRLIVFSFLCGHSLSLLVSQRTGRGVPGGHDSSFPALFCWTYTVVYTILGSARPHGYDVELAIALCGLQAMLHQEQVA
ncbi:hypothetical protein O1611_g4441 [Lasiodiplodia mahajangana]|uniref:Uncharacterized protein n=1 Tax=Lasiodiplodia mahajangana TaxID=1108764 RepID=A0ACC2JPJ7_9PEZI|nr:hypothetical protein O1611_g4441 [Lasiodiplodia mahajangana]